MIQIEEEEEKLKEGGKKKLARVKVFDCEMDERDHYIM